MQTSESPGDQNFSGNAAERRVEYTKYANQFDHQNKYNPAYHELRKVLLDWVPRFGLSERPSVCDLGAGTGNFILSLNELIPDASFVHLDKDTKMNELARAKYSNAGLENVSVVDSLMQDADFSPGSFDLILCVNALNTAPPQLPTLKLMYSWLRPSGWLYLVDFGRKQNVYDWVFYCAMHAARTAGIRSMLKYAKGCAEGFKQNRNASFDQSAGSMWLHSTSDLESLVKEAGFHVEHSAECYRGYSDMVIAQRQPIVIPERCESQSEGKDLASAPTNPS